LVAAFVGRKRSHFFLTSQGGVVGLVTIAHLNTREVKLYLYMVLSELEILLANLVDDALTNEQVEARTFADPDWKSDGAPTADYRSARNSNVEARRRLPQPTASRPSRRRRGGVPLAWLSGRVGIPPVLPPDQRVAQACCPSSTPALGEPKWLRRPIGSDSNHHRYARAPAG
jgi:hypothetical protein